PMVDPVSLLEKYRMELSDRQLRMMACFCSRRILRLIENSIFDELMSFAERRAQGNVTQDELELQRARSVPLYDAEYPGHGPPSARALAMSAVGEAAFTDSAFSAANSACAFASEAVAIAAAKDVVESD